MMLRPGVLVSTPPSASMHVRVRRRIREALPAPLSSLGRDVWLLYLTRFLRLFAYGLLSVVLVFYLVGLGLSEVQTGMVLTLTLAGDTVVSLYLTTQADRIGRRRMLVAGALLMTAAGLVFAGTSNLTLLVAAGIVGVISPSGGEVGPFLPIEQAALTHVVPAAARTEVFAWYTLAGSMGTATGALAGGVLTEALQQRAVTPLASYRTMVVVYAALGIVLAVLFTRLSRASERAHKMPWFDCSASARPGASSPSWRRSLRSMRLAAASSSRASPPTGSTCAT